MLGASDSYILISITSISTYISSWRLKLCTSWFWFCHQRFPWQILLLCTSSLRKIYSLNSNENLASLGVTSIHTHSTPPTLTIFLIFGYKTRVIPGPLSDNPLPLMIPSFPWNDLFLKLHGFFFFSHHSKMSLWPKVCS